MIKKALVLLPLTFFFGCQRSIQSPKTFLDSLFAQARIVHDEEFEYKLSYLPLDYFMARALTSESPESISDQKVLRKSIENQYGGGVFFLLRLGLDSAYRTNPRAQDGLTEKMVKLQSKQEEGRQEVTARLKNGSEIHPDMFLAQSDWVSHQGATVLFCFQGRTMDEIESLEFGKNFVQSSNQIVFAKDLAPKFRLKG